MDMALFRKPNLRIDAVAYSSFRSIYAPGLVDLRVLNYWALQLKGRHSKNRKPSSRTGCRVVLGAGAKRKSRDPQMRDHGTSEN
jgi:hypothetical protein